MEINPEQERERLTERYAGMPLDKLQKIAADWHELTEMAQATLETEIQRRGSSIPGSVKAPKLVTPQSEVKISIPEALPQETDDPTMSIAPDNSSGAKLVMVRRFRDLPEALLAKGSFASAE